MQVVEAGSTSVVVDGTPGLSELGSGSGLGQVVLESKLCGTVDGSGTGFSLRDLRVPVATGGGWVGACLDGAALAFFWKPWSTL